jgi:HSP20 family protein
MNPVTRWDPFKDMDDLQSPLTQLLGLCPTRNAGGQELMTVSEWSPSVDISEDDREWLIQADLPDVKREDVKVAVENGVLIITGERRFRQEAGNKRYHRIERGYGTFLRSFALPKGTDVSQVSQEFREGVLRVHLPKSGPAKAGAMGVKANKVSLPFRPPPSDAIDETTAVPAISSHE